MNIIQGITQEFAAIVADVMRDVVREELARAGVAPAQQRASLSVTEAAQMLGVSIGMIYKMEHQGTIKASVISSTPAKRTLRIPFSEIERISEGRPITK